MVAANLEYGQSATWSRRFKVGRKYAVIFGAMSIPWTYFVCPVCQWPNRGELQIVPWEQRFKNYYDKTYHTFDDANKGFYDTLTSDARKAELRE